MSAKNDAARDTTYRTIFQNMDAERAQEIREAYYKTIDGLQTLAESLEIADFEIGDHAGNVLLEEHLHAAEALEALRKSQLGRVL